MDRFVIREPRANSDYPQGNQIIAFMPNAGSNNSMVPPENIFYTGNYASEFPNMQHMVSSTYLPVNQLVSSTAYHQSNPGQCQAQGQMMSGIDPRYLVGYSDNSAQYIVTGQQIQSVPANAQTSNVQTSLGNVQNAPGNLRSGPGNSQTHVNVRAFQGSVQSIPGNVQAPGNARSVPGKQTPPAFGEDYQNRTVSGPSRRNLQVTPQAKGGINKKRVEPVEETNEIQNQILTRANKLKALLKTGPRVFSGPIENILKWHKSLQHIGILIMYEVVAKCVSIRPGASRAKNLVIRDENGPAMQVVYYEIDFLLPNLKPPCTVRVIGKMMAGTSRLHAFNIRLATGDDVMMLSRRAAIATHHVTKLCKECGNNP